MQTYAFIESSEREMNLFKIRLKKSSDVKSANTPSFQTPSLILLVHPFFTKSPTFIHFCVKSAIVSSGHNISLTLFHYTFHSFHSDFHSFHYDLRLFSYDLKKVIDDFNKVNIDS